MTDRKQRMASLALTLVLLGLNLVALNYLVSGWSMARIDLTDEGRFSITPATKRILASVDEDLTVYGYFSKRTHPKLAPLVPEIVDLLEEYRAVSGGRVHVEIIDPGDDEQAEQEAADRFGVSSTPFRLASKYESGIVNAYFALVVKYGDQYERYGFGELIQVDPLPDGDIEVRLRNLEYDLTRAIKKVVYGFRSTNELFERIDSPVRLTAVMSPDSLPEMFGEVPDALRTAADELKQAGGDKFVFEELDPTKDEAARVEVESRYGLREMTLGLFGDSSFYLYGILEVGGRLEQVVLTGESLTAASIREAVENSLRRHTPGFLKTVGIVAPDPPQLPPEIQMQMQMRQPPPEFEEIKRYLGQNLQVTTVDLSSAAGVPSEVDVLLVLKPKGLGEQEIYRLDQYLTRGGRVVLCAGSYEADFSANGLNVMPVDSGLSAWLAHHGVTIGDSLVLDDRNQALPLPEVRNTPFGQVRSWVLAPYPYLVQVREEGFLNPEITSTLDAVGIYWGSPLTVDDAALGSVEALPILESSSKSWTSDDLTGVSRVDYRVPDEGTEPQLLAVALNGKFTSYYADREPPPDSDAAVPAGEGGVEPAGSAKVALYESPETRLVVIGNAEFLSDFVARTIGQMDGSFFVENLRFIENVLDWTMLDNDMLSIRARGVASRRLDRLDKGAEITVETVNYVVPLVLILGLAGYLYWKRRRTPPLFGATPEAPASRPSHEEA